MAANGGFVHKANYALFPLIVITVEMRMLRWIPGLKWIEKSEEIRARADVVNVNEKIREARMGWLGHVERKTEEDVVMRARKTEMTGH